MIACGWVSSNRDSVYKESPPYHPPEPPKEPKHELSDAAFRSIFEKVENEVKTDLTPPT